MILFFFFNFSTKAFHLLIRAFVLLIFLNILFLFIYIDIIKGNRTNRAEVILLLK